MLVTVLVLLFVLVFLFVLVLLLFLLLLLLFLVPVAVRMPVRVAVTVVVTVIVEVVKGEQPQEVHTQPEEGDQEQLIRVDFLREESGGEAEGNPPVGAKIAPMPRGGQGSQ